MSTGRLRDPVAGRSGDICETLVIYVFLNATQKHIKFTLTDTQHFIVDCGSEKFSEQYTNLNNKNQIIKK